MWWSRGRRVVGYETESSPDRDRPIRTPGRERWTMTFSHRMKNRVCRGGFHPPPRAEVSRRFRLRDSPTLRDLGDALSPAKANLLDGNTWVKCSPRMVYGPIVPTSCRHAALPPFSLSLSLSASPRAFVPLLPTRKLSHSLLLVLSISLSFSLLSLVFVSSLPRARYSIVASCSVSRASGSPRAPTHTRAVLRPAQRRGIRTVEARAY